MSRMGRPRLAVGVTAGALVTGIIAVPVAAALFPAILAMPSPADRAAADRPSGAAPLPAAGGRRRPADPVAIALLLADARVVLSAAARSDIGSGTVDGRVVAVLAFLARTHSVEVSVVRTGHSEFVAGTGRISNHFFGRAVDVVAIDGEAVSAASASARRTVHELLDAPAPLRPDELGSPFADVADPAAFSDPGHRDHLHIGFRAPFPGPS